VVYETIHPALDDFISQYRCEFFEILGLNSRKRSFARNALDLQPLDNAVFYNDFDLAFAITVATMNVNRLMLIRIEKNNNPKILI
jgi:hypothetical protein